MYYNINNLYEQDDSESIYTDEGLSSYGGSSYGGLSYGGSSAMTKESEESKQTASTGALSKV